ncbi:hypothetical protein Hanom_Chr07g00641281 [Helianthus anomalus]
MIPNCFEALAPKMKIATTFQGKIPQEKFGQFPETEDVIVNVEELEPEFQNFDSDDESILISYDGDDEIPPEAELVTEDPHDSDSHPIKHRRRDPRPGVYVEQDQQVDDDESLYTFDFETAATTDTTFDFKAADTQMDVSTESAETSVPSETPVVTSVPLETPTVTSTSPEIPVIRSSSTIVYDAPCSSSGVRYKEPRFDSSKIPFVDDSSDDDDVSVSELKKRMVILGQDSIRKDAKIVQLEDTIA